MNSKTVTNLENERRFPLSERRRFDLLKDYYYISTKAEWAKIRILVMAEMLEEKEENWFANQLKEIANDIERPN